MRETRGGGDRLTRPVHELIIIVRGHEGEDPDLDPRADTGNELQTANYT